MSDEKTTPEVPEGIDALAAIVAAGTDDASDTTESTTPGKRPWLGMAAIVSAAVALLVIAGVVVFFVLQNPPAPQPGPRRAMVITAIAGIEAVIAGDGNTLATLSDAEMKAQITPELIETMSVSGLKVTFSEPQWTEDDFIIQVSTNAGGGGAIVGGPVPDGKNVVIFRTMGHIGATTGGVELTANGSGWLISEFAVGRTSPTTESASPTGTPSATSTP